MPRTSLETGVVRVERPDGGVLGAGFLLTDTLAVTCHHVVAEAGGPVRLRLHTGGEPVEADLLLRAAKKTTNLATTNKTKLGNFPLRYPPLSEQQAIVAHLTAAEVKIAEMQKAQQQDATLVAQLEQSILAAAFRGEV